MFGPVTYLQAWAMNEGGEGRGGFPCGVEWSTPREIILNMSKLTGVRVVAMQNVLYVVLKWCFKCHHFK